MTALLGLSLIALIVIGGALSLSATLAFGMANADPTCGPLVRNGVVQLPAMISWWIWLVLGVRQAYRALTLSGGEALLVGALGWGVFLGGVTATMLAYAALVWIDLRLARRRER